MLRAVITVFGLVFLVCIASSARADQRREWITAVQKPGTYANLDLIFPGYQAGIEQRTAIYGAANQLLLRASSLLPTRFHEGQLDVDLRILALTLGAGVGVHDDFRLIAFAPGQDSSRDARRRRERAEQWTHERWAYLEGRITLTLPLNQHLIFHNVNTFRREGRPARSFDWRNGMMHDGRFLRSDLQLFLRHRDWGALGPMMQIFVSTLNGQQRTQMNYGFALITRPGITARNDVFYMQVLYHLGSTLSPHDNRNSYGGLAFLGPLTFILAYRVMLDLGG